MNIIGLKFFKDSPLTRGAIRRGRGVKNAKFCPKFLLIRGLTLLSFRKDSPLIRGARGVKKRGFSLIGVLTASLMGIIVTLGLTKMMSNMNTEVKQMKATAHRIDLLAQISSIFTEDCQASLGQSLSDTQLDNLKKGGKGADKAPIQWTLLKDGDGSEILNTDDQLASNKDKMKRLYNMEGHSRFQLKCKDPADCDCSSASSTNPCPKDWILSLWTMSYKNNLPVYQEIYKQSLRISYSGSARQFTCNFASSVPEEWRVGDRACAQQTTGSGLTCVGYYAGHKNSTGSNNTFYGRLAGRGVYPHHVTGSDNSFYGEEAGHHIRTGSGNTFFGHFSGYRNTTSSHNTFYGRESGKNYDNSLYSTGDSNTFFGTESGYRISTGSNNLFLGHKAGYKTTTDSNRVNIGNVIYAYTDPSRDPLDNNIYPSRRGIAIHGQFRICDLLGWSNQEREVACSEVKIDPSSSREYKKNIVPFPDYKKALELLLTTPLFTYQYKEDYPEKERMGVIAEELPESLQLPTDPVQPDWISIYGYLWAGIKALHKELQYYSSNLNNALFLEQSLVPSDSVCPRQDLVPEKNSQIFQTEPVNPPSPPYQGGILSAKQGIGTMGGILSAKQGMGTMGGILLAKYRVGIRGGIIDEMQSYQQSIEEIEKGIAQLKKQEEIFKQELQKLKQQIQN